MGDFKNSSWAAQEFSDNYLDKADVYIIERRRLLGLLKTLYGHLTGGQRGLSVCDLGAGDGIIAETLLKLDDTIDATLLDASASMLEKAKERLTAYENLKFILMDFEAVIDNPSELPRSDFFVSSMAIHHLDMKGKTLFFNKLFENLNPGGFFINIDTVRPPTEELEQLYFGIWSNWMKHSMSAAGIKDQTPEDVIKEYKSPASSNKPDTIGDQLEALKKVGFVNVDCFYKNGIFAIYMGQKL